MHVSPQATPTSHSLQHFRFETRVIGINSSCVAPRGEAGFDEAKVRWVREQITNTTRSSCVECSNRISFTRCVRERSLCVLQWQLVDSFLSTRKGSDPTYVGESRAVKRNDMR